MDDSMIGRWLSELPLDDPTRKRTSRPQLRRFIHHDKPIHHLKTLGQGSEGVVYRVRIEGQEYALKVFYSSRTGNTASGPPKLTKRQEPYTSPFSHECRAFARLDSVNENGTWAVKCHGWMKLSDEQFKRSRYCSRWAIVKDYLPSIEDVPEIRRKMSIARGALLHPDDTLPRNYRGSFLVDLGRVKTYPYPRPFWSTVRKREFYDSFLVWVSVRDGDVVEGWLNEEFKENIAQAEKLEELKRTNDQAVALHQY